MREIRQAIRLLVLLRALRFLLRSRLIMPGCLRLLVKLLFQRVFSVAVLLPLLLLLRLLLMLRLLVVALLLAAVARRLVVVLRLAELLAAVALLHPLAALPV
jgi:hypothetical protein